MSTFLLVPGAGGEAWYWHRLVPLLGSAGHTVVPVDLPTGDAAAGLAEYADAVVATGRGRGPIRVVAQSMGAYAASLAAERLAVEEIVLVNAMVPAPQESPGEWWDATDQPAARAAHEAAEGRDPDAPFDPVDGFFHDVPDDVRAAAFARGEPAQADRPFTEPWPLDHWPDVPTRGVAGLDDRLFPAPFQVRVAKDRLDVSLDTLPGGHLLALANPTALAAWLLA